MYWGYGKTKKSEVLICVTQTQGTMFMGPHPPLTDSQGNTESVIPACRVTRPLKEEVRNNSLEEGDFTFQWELRFGTGH